MVDTAGGMAGLADIPLRAHVWTVATLLPLAVRFVPLKRLLRLMTPPAWWRPYRRVATERIVAVVSARLATPRNMKRRACLRRGLLLYHFLRLAGRAAELRFGVYPQPDAAGRMHAHAWVTLDGQDLAAPPDAPHAELLRCGGEQTPRSP